MFHRFAWRPCICVRHCGVLTSFPRTWVVQDRIHDAMRSYISPFISPLSPCTGPQHCSARGPPPAPSGGNGRDHSRVAVPERWWRPLRRRAQSKDERGLRTRWNTVLRCLAFPIRTTVSAPLYMYILEYAAVSQPRLLPNLPPTHVPRAYREAASHRPSFIYILSFVHSILGCPRVR